MKYLTLLTALVLMGLSASIAFAQGAAHKDILIKVNGMVCDFCAQSVWKVFKEYDAVNDVEIDLDTGLVTVHLQPGKTLGEEEINKSITYAGYDLVSVERADHG